MPRCWISSVIGNRILETRAQICEYLRLDAGGKIGQGLANHLAH